MKLSNKCHNDVQLTSSKTDTDWSDWLKYADWHNRAVECISFVTNGMLRMLTIWLLRIESILITEYGRRLWNFSGIFTNELSDHFHVTVAFGRPGGETIHWILTDSLSFIDIWLDCIFGNPGRSENQIFSKVSQKMGINIISTKSRNETKFFSV